MLDTFSANWMCYKCAEFHLSAVTSSWPDRRPFSIPLYLELTLFTKNHAIWQTVIAYAHRQGTWWWRWITNDIWSICGCGLHTLELAAGLRKSHSFMIFSACHVSDETEALVNTSFCIEGGCLQVTFSYVTRQFLIALFPGFSLRLLQSLARTGK